MNKAGERVKQFWPYQVDRNVARTSRLQEKSAISDTGRASDSRSICGKGHSSETDASSIDPSTPLRMVVLTQVK
jgi:hypothetical protein